MMQTTNWPAGQVDQLVGWLGRPTGLADQPATPAGGPGRMGRTAETKTLLPSLNNLSSQQSTFLNAEKEIFKSCQKLFNLGHYGSDVIIKIIDFFLKKKKWRKAQTIAENAFSFCPKSRNLEIRIAGCCFHLNEIDEAMYLLNLNQMDRKDKSKFLFLFPELEYFVTKT